MNYRELFSEFRVELKITALLNRGRAVTRSRLEHSNVLEPFIVLYQGHRSNLLRYVVYVQALVGSKGCQAPAFIFYDNLVEPSGGASVLSSLDLKQKHWLHLVEFYESSAPGALSALCIKEKRYDKGKLR